MGLFSFTSKNKQENAAEDSGHYSRADEQASTAQARSKRASNAAGSGSGAGLRASPVDPVLPEKKRARRRLVGAIALALAVAVGLPMILDSEQKPLSSDIAIQIPSRDKVPGAVTPVASATVTPAASAAVAPAGASKVDASAALDQSEEIVPQAPLPKALPKTAQNTAPNALPAAPAVQPAESVPVPLVKAPRAEAKKIDAPKADVRHEVRPSATRAVPRMDVPAAARLPAAGDDTARAEAILEAKPAVKAHEATGAKFVLQVAALASQEKVDELQARLSEAGIKSYTQKMPNVTGTRVRLGPFGSKEEADKVRAKLKQIGLDGFLVPS